MLSIAPTMGGAVLDLAVALRIAESLGVAAPIAVALLGAIRGGLSEGMASRRRPDD